jgi:hypothetical protein
MNSTNTRAEQSRINGAQSHGPTSDSGKARSSKNALKHGFAATVNNVLRIEDPDEFNAHVAGIHAAWSPKDYYEKVLVDQIASITWRHARLVATETFLLGGQISLQNANLEAMHDSGPDPYFKLTLAWQSLARKAQTPDPNPTLPLDGFDINSIDLLRRYNTMLDRQHRSAIANLRQYREEKQAEQQRGKNEPEKPAKIHVVTPLPAPKPEPEPEIAPAIQPEPRPQATPEAA